MMPMVANAACTGYVRNAASGQGLSGISVSNSTRGGGATTDMHGYFALATCGVNDTLEFYTMAFSSPQMPIFTTTRTVTTTTNGVYYVDNSNTGCENSLFGAGTSATGTTFTSTWYMCATSRVVRWGGMDIDTCTSCADGGELLQAQVYGSDLCSNTFTAYRCPTSCSKNIYVEDATPEDFGSYATWPANCAVAEFGYFSGAVNSEQVFSCTECNEGYAPVSQAWAGNNGCTSSTKLYHNVCTCAMGYYSDGSTCTRCPADAGGVYGTNSLGAVPIDACYIPAETNSADPSGELTYTSNCNY